MSGKFDAGEFADFDEGRLQHWVGWHPDPVERVRLQREHWLKWLERHHPFAFGRLALLAKRGCERDQLVFYLYNLKFDEEASRLSEAEFEDIIKHLDRAAEDLEVLINSGLGFVLDEAWSGPGELQELPYDLSEFVERLESFENFASLKKNVLLDDAKAAIVRHVLQRSNKHHHGEVAALIGAALEKTYSHEAHEKWRKAHKVWVSRHGELLKSETRYEAKWRELNARADLRNQSK